ncbi:MAG: hypothetical protein BBJ57_13170 [Desulfobacterales bacterium PC51MH44]|nr:MAG: hypothetical protein BBJ57_13170 [Desulfobacterales bacterium PC51MH44]
MPRKHNLIRLSVITCRFISFGLISIGVLNATGQNLYAHPHVFIVQRINIVFYDQGLAGFKMRWSFDAMFSSMIAGDYDRNQNGQLESKEVQTIKEKAFNYISNYNYFTFIKIDGKPFEVKYIKDFKAILKNNKLIYEFFVPCHVAAIRQFKKIIIAAYDPSYYTAIFFAKNRPASLSFSESFDVKSAILKDKTTSIYYGMVHPWALFLEFRLKQ